MFFLGRCFQIDDGISSCRSPSQGAWKEECEHLHLELSHQGPGAALSPEPIEVHLPRLALLHAALRPQVYLDRPSVRVPQGPPRAGLEFLDFLLF